MYERDQHYHVTRRESILMFFVNLAIILSAGPFYFLAFVMSAFGANLLFDDEEEDPEQAVHPLEYVTED